MATLTHAQRIQPEKPSPTVYAHQPPSTDRWKRLPQIPTLSHPQRNQLEKPHPDRYAGNCPARIETGQSSAAQDHNPQTHITPQPSRSQMKTVSPDRPRLIVPVLFHPHLSPPVSSPSPFFYRPVSPPTALAFPQRSQTAKPSPNSYAQPPPPRSNGDSISNPLHSEHLTVAKRRSLPQTATLSRSHRGQTETASPIPYTQNTSA